MPKIKTRKVDEEKISVPKSFSDDDKDEEKSINPDLILEESDIILDDENEIDDDEIDALDDDEVDPFKDKWEE